jgi:hypothetical protein
MHNHIDRLIPPMIRLARPLLLTCFLFGVARLAASDTMDMTADTKDKPQNPYFGKTMLTCGSPKAAR